MIPIRWKIYAFVAAAFLLGLLRWRSIAVQRAIEDLERQRAESRLKAAKKAKEIRDDVESQDDVHLAERARQWVRDDSK